MGPPDERRGPAQEPGPQRSAVPQIASIVPGWANHRRRQLHRLAVIAQVRAAYGPAADLRLTPPGPTCCPENCPWCPPPLVPGEPDYMAGLTVRSA